MGDRMRMRVAAMAMTVACAAGFHIQPAKAETLSELLPALLESHNRVKASVADLQAARNLTEVARGGWYPTATPSAEYGYEKQNKPSGSADTSMYFRKYELQLKQLAWDFGATNARIGASKLSETQQEVVLEGVRQGLLLEAVSAYINFVRAHQQFNYARESEANIRRQTGLEQSRVERGSGLATDVLQAKTQLAGAEAARVSSEGALVAARNRFRAVFGRDIESISSLQMPPVPHDLMPSTLADAVHDARANNVQLKVAQIGTDVARKSVDATKAASFYPKIEAVAELRDEINLAGTAGNQVEHLAKLQASLPFNLGFTAVNTLRAAESGITAADARLADTRDLVEEQVRNAWENLSTQKAKAEFLRNQANIAAEFLELARKERRLGTRSLLDVLNGETALISSNSSAASAEADVSVAAYTLLATIGRLDTGAIR